MNHEPRYVKYARGFMGLFSPEGMDGIVLGLAIAAGIFVGIIWWMGW